ncbi:MAG TPA: hypothetical protein DCO83_16390 [Mucilaginibacter sp.]|jgi:hypothetical protein|nr:hypothetical protein [Mucilaginibacter sp.]
METIIVQPKTKKQQATIEAILMALDVSFKKEEKSPYSPEFVAKIKESIEQAKQGNVVVIKDPKNIWPSIL